MTCYESFAMYRGAEHCRLQLISFRSSATSGPEPHQVDLLERVISYLELPGKNTCHAVGIWTCPIKSQA